MTKKLFILLFFASTTLTLWGQNIVFTVDSADYSLGTLFQHDTLITHIFEFCNEGTDTVYIQRIEPTCLFTISEWTNEPIVPDMTGFITVEFDCRELYGPFSKELFVYGNMPTIKLSLNGRRNGTPGEQ